MAKANQAVRLPTEAEWEYICRAGTTTKYHSGDKETDLARTDWYMANSNGSTHPVGQKVPNEFGLFDLHGNVGQLCQDWYGENYYSKSAELDPEGPTSGIFRVRRGGSWANAPQLCGSAFRGAVGLNHFSNGWGFRVVVLAFRTQ
jgi:formylglycine-generating enzyme required for sulfatase activity